MFRYTCGIRLAVIRTVECEGVVTQMLRSDQGPRRIWNSKGSIVAMGTFACAHHFAGKTGDTAPLGVQQFGLCGARVRRIAENLCLRQRLLVLQRRHPQPRLGNADRRFWIIAADGSVVGVVRSSL
jgi:hypothetical protein